ETILILVFMILFDLTRRGEPSLKYKSKAAGSLDAKKIGRSAFAALSTGDIPVVRAFDALGNVAVAIVHLVNLFHTGEGFFQIPRSLVNQAEIVPNLLLHLVHGHDFP